MIKKFKIHYRHICWRIEETSAHHNKRIPVDLSTYRARVMRFRSNEIDLPQTYRGLLAINPAAVRMTFRFRRGERERSPDARGPAVDGAPAARTISPWLSWGDPRWRLLRCTLYERGVDDDGGGVSLREEETPRADLISDGGRLEEKVDPRGNLLRVMSNVFEGSWRKRGEKRSLQRVLFVIAAILWSFSLCLQANRVSCVNVQGKYNILTHVARILYTRIE